MRPNAKYGKRQAPEPEDEELEMGEPLSEEAGTPVVKPGKIAARRGNFGGGTPVMPKPTNPNDGQIVLASAKYLQRDPDPEGRREQQRRESREKQEEEQQDDLAFARHVLDSGVVGGSIAMLVAVALIVVGSIVFDELFFYPSVLFVIGFIAVLRGGSQGK
jgi:hypothetical protein